MRFLVGERGEVAVAAVLPESECEDCGSERRSADDQLPPAPRHEQRHNRSREEDEIRRLHERREAGGETCYGDRPRVAVLDRAEREHRGQEQEHRPRVVRHRRQSERHRQELVDVAVVVAVDEQRDRDVRPERPDRGRPVADHTAADARAELVHAPEGDRRDDERLQHHCPRQAAEKACATDPRKRHKQHRPPLGDGRDGDRAVAEQPARRPEPDLVAALVEEPAVVIHAGRERDEREPVDDEERDEQAPRLAQRDGVPRPDEAAPGSRHARARACSRYQAIVRSSPSRRLVVARKPKRSAAFVVSRSRRGCPFGFDGSQTICPS